MSDIKIQEIKEKQKEFYNTPVSVPYEVSWLCDQAPAKKHPNFAKVHLISKHLTAPLTVLQDRLHLFDPLIVWSIATEKENKT